jgi:polar amino acid transport system permease protein
MDLSLFLRSLKFIAPALRVTIILTVVALGFGLLCGLLLALVRVYGGRAGRAAASIYSRVVRSLPTLVVLFIFYNLAWSVFRVGGPAAVVIALTACTAAYQSEIFRGAIQSIGAGQMAAARSLGMTRGVALRSVIIPQALRLAIPAWSNEAAIVLKDSSLASAVGTTEIFRRAQQFGAATHQSLPAFLACGLLYLCLTFMTNRALDAVQKRYGIKT